MASDWLTQSEAMTQIPIRLTSIKHGNVLVIQTPEAIRYRLDTYPPLSTCTDGGMANSHGLMGAIWWFELPSAPSVGKHASADGIVTLRQPTQVGTRLRAFFYTIYSITETALKFLKLLQ